MSFLTKQPVLLRRMKTALDVFTDIEDRPFGNMYSFAFVWPFGEKRSKADADFISQQSSFLRNMRIYTLGFCQVVTWDKMSGEPVPQNATGVVHENITYMGFELTTKGKTAKANIVKGLAHNLACDPETFEVDLDIDFHEIFKYLEQPVVDIQMIQKMASYPDEKFTEFRNRVVHEKLVRELRADGRYYRCND